MAYTSHGHHIPGTSNIKEYPLPSTNCGGPEKCKVCHEEGLELMNDLEIDKDVHNGETHSEDTLVKVLQALINSGLHYQQATDAINSMLNDGILFRERL